MSQDKKPAWFAIRIIMLHALLEFEQKLNQTPIDQIDIMSAQWLKMTLKELGQELVKRGCPDIFSTQELPDVTN